MEEPIFPTSDISYLKRNFFNTAIADIYRALDGKSLVGSFILTFCLIDYLTWIEMGDVKFGFNQWVKKRLLPQNIFYLNRDAELYSVRNGLVHSYGPSQKMLKKEFAGYTLYHCQPSDHMQKINTDILRICLYSLLTETIFAAHQLFEEAKVNCPPDQLERMNKQMKIIGVHPPDKFVDMHSALACIDEPTELTLNDLKADYCSKILYA